MTQEDGLAKVLPNTEYEEEADDIISILLGCRYNDLKPLIMEEIAKYKEHEKTVIEEAKESNRESDDVYEELRDFFNEKIDEELVTTHFNIREDDRYDHITDIQDIFMSSLYDYMREKN